MTEGKKEEESQKGPGNKEEQEQVTLGGKYNSAI